MSNDHVTEIIENLRTSRAESGRVFLFVSLSDIDPDILRDIERHPEIELEIDNDEKTVCIFFRNERTPLISETVPSETAVPEGRVGHHLGNFRGEQHQDGPHRMKSPATDASCQSILVSGRIPIDEGYQNLVFELMASMSAQVFPVQTKEMIGLRIILEALRFRVRAQNKSAVQRYGILESVRFGIRPYDTYQCTCIEVNPVPARRRISFVKKGFGGGIAAGPSGAKVNMESRWESSHQRYDYKIEAVCGSINLQTDAEWLWQLESWNDGSAYRSLNERFTTAELKGWMGGRRPACYSFLAKRGALNAEWEFLTRKNTSFTRQRFLLYACPCFVQVSTKRELQQKLKLKSIQLNERCIDNCVFSEFFYFSNADLSSSSSKPRTHQDLETDEELVKSRLQKAGSQTELETDQGTTLSETDNSWSELCKTPGEIL